MLFETITRKRNIINILPATNPKSRIIRYILGEYVARNTAVLATRELQTQTLCVPYLETSTLAIGPENRYRCTMVIKYLQF